MTDSLIFNIQMYSILYNFVRLVIDAPPEAIGNQKRSDVSIGALTSELVLFLLCPPPSQSSSHGSKPISFHLSLELCISRRDHAFGQKEHR
jgi:hypothetical protein